MARARQGTIITPQGAQGPQGPQGVPGEVTQAQLDAAIEELITDLSTKWYGITIPTDGSQNCLQTGNPVFHQNHPFLEEGDIAMVLLGDDLVENEVIATPQEPEIPSGSDLSGANGQVMVRVKKFYFQNVLNAQGDLVEKRWSREKLPGFTIHPYFTDGTRVAELAYLSVYEGGNVNESGVDKLTSVSGVAPLTSVPLSTFRSRAAARNTGQSSNVMWHDYDFWAQDLIQFYFYLYYASLDSQGKLPGYTEASSYDATYKRNTGRTNGLLTMNGSIDAELGVGETDEDLAAVLSVGDKIANRFLFIENIFGHIWKMLDGVSFDGRIGQQNTVFLSKNPAQYSSVEAEILANYENQNLNLTGSSGYISTVHHGFIPKGVGGASSSYFGDYFYSYLDDETRDYLRLVRAGGRLTNGVFAGVGCRTSYNDLSHAHSDSGSRLCAKKFS